MDALLAKIRSERQRLGLRQEDAAKKAGYSVTFWCQVELGHKPASMKVIRKMAHAVGLEVVVTLRRRKPTLDKKAKKRKDYR